MNYVDQILSVPQDAAMLIGAGIASVLHLGCGMAKGRRCEPGRLALFTASAAGMVAGVYVFFEALKATFSSIPSAMRQHAVWAGIGALAVAAFTLDLLITEIKAFFQRVDPILTETKIGLDTQPSPQSQESTTQAD
jgi:Flp pilus assembly pilin Flp